MRQNGLLAAWIVVCLGLAYGNDMGRGFIADDFSWIYFSRLDALSEIPRRFFETPMGFYRPLVALSFAFDHWVYGMAPMGYAVTNFLLALAIVAAIVALVLGLGWSMRAGLFAAALWVFNFHGVAMALTWVSGRTSLLTTLFAVLAAVAVGRRSRLGVGLFTLGALLSKEEPIMLPVILLLWVVSDRWAARGQVGQAFADAVSAVWPAFLAAAMYVLLRSRTEAFTPSTAPPVYALSLSPRVILPNIPEYLDRSSTFVAAVLLLGFLLFVRRRVWLDAAERRTALKGLLWLVLGFAATIMVPIRSDLYACFPSVGAALIGMAGGTALWRAMPVSRRFAATIALCVLPLPLLPIYWARNAFAKNDAMLSARVVREVTAALARSDATRLEIFENPQDIASVSSAFRSTLPRAIVLVSGRTVDVELKDLTQTPPPDAPPAAGTLRFVFADPRS